MSEVKIISLVLEQSVSEFIIRHANPANFVILLFFTRPLSLVMCPLYYSSFSYLSVLFTFDSLFSFVKQGFTL